LPEAEESKTGSFESWTHFLICGKSKHAAVMSIVMATVCSVCEAVEGASTSMLFDSVVTGWSCRWSKRFEAVDEVGRT
jgi:hypothetical protein